MSKKKYFLLGIILLPILFILAKTISDRIYWNDKFTNQSQFIYLYPSSEANQLWEYDTKTFASHVLVDLKTDTTNKPITNELMVHINKTQDKIGIRYTGNRNGFKVYDRTLKKTIFEIDQDKNARVLFSWSPDGTKIAYSYGNNDLRYLVSTQELHLVDFATSQPQDKQIDDLITRNQTLEGPFESFMWSQDGQKLFFRKQNQYFAYNIQDEKTTSTDTAFIDNNKYAVTDTSRTNYFRPGDNIFIDSSGCGDVLSCRQFVVLNNKKVVESGVINQVIWSDKLQVYVVDAGSSFYAFDEFGRKIKIANGDFIAILD